MRGRSQRARARLHPPGWLGCLRLASRPSETRLADAPLHSAGWVSTRISAVHYRLRHNARRLGDCGRSVFERLVRWGGPEQLEPRFADRAFSLDRWWSQVD